MVYFLATFAICALLYLAFDLAASFVRARTKKVGGLHFFAWRRLRVSFCLAKASR